MRCEPLGSQPVKGKGVLETFKLLLDGQPSAGQLRGGHRLPAGLVLHAAAVALQYVQVQWQDDNDLRPSACRI